MRGGKEDVSKNSPGKREKKKEREKDPRCPNAKRLWGEKKKGGRKDWKRGKNELKGEVGCVAASTGFWYRKM